MAVPLVRIYFIYWYLQILQLDVQSKIWREGKTHLSPSSSQNPCGTKDGKKKAAHCYLLKPSKVSAMSKTITQPPPAQSCLLLLIPTGIDRKVAQLSHIF